MPEYQETQNKKPLVPLLRAKKELVKAVEQGDVRLKLVNEKLAEVEMNQMNKEVAFVLFRPLTPLRTPTNISKRFRRRLRTRTGREF